MSKIKIPDHLLSKLGAEMKMDCHWIDVKLANGKVHNKMEVRGSRYITGYFYSSGGNCEINFKSEDIKDIRRQTFFTWWPFW